MLRVFGRVSICLIIVWGTVAADGAFGDPRKTATVSRLPLAFEADQDGAGFVARGRGFRVRVTGGDAAFATARAGDRAADVVTMHLEGARRGARPLSEMPLATRVNYFIGRDPARWRRDVPTYARVRVAGVYPGIDLVYYGRDGRLEYDFIVAPGADPDGVALRFDGAAHVRERDGGLVVDAANGALTVHRPIAYQIVDGIRHDVAADYVVDGARATLSLGRYDRTRELVIDPTFDYSTLLGGTAYELATAVAVDTAGAAYVIGQTSSPTFPPAAPTVQDIQNSWPCIFVAKVGPSGASLDYLTYVGGSYYDAPTDIAVDALGQAYVSGAVGSNDFPIVNGYQTTRSYGGTAMFKLDASGHVAYSTYLNGGSNGVTADGIATDGTGVAYLAGYASDPKKGNPTPGFNGFATSPSAFLPDGTGAYVMKIDTTKAGLASWAGATMYHGMQSGSGGTNGVRVAVDSSFNVYLAGNTTETTLPTPNGFQTTYGGGNSDAFLARFTPDLKSLVYATYFGGPGDDNFYLTANYEQPAAGFAVDNEGHAWIGGSTNSMPFPTSQGALKPALTGAFYGNYAWDGFVGMFDTNASGAASQVWATLLGGYPPDNVSTLAVDRATKHVFVAGQTNTGSWQSGPFPTTPATAVQSDLPQGDHSVAHAYLARLSETGALVYSTLIAGLGTDRGYGVATDGLGHAWVVGETDANGFPTTTGAFQEAAQGAGDAFVVRIDTGAVVAADLTITKTGLPTTVANGSPVTYTLTVTNSGPSPATGVVVTDLLPSGLWFQSASLQGCSAFPPIICPIGDLPVGGSVMFTITAIAKQSGVLTNTATVTGNEPDPDPVHNTATAQTTVTPVANLTLVKTTVQDPVLLGSSAAFNLVFTNFGPDPATGITVTDSLPAGLTFTATGSSPQCAPAPGNKVTCTLPSPLQANGVAFFTIAATASTPGAKTNTAVVLANEPDPAPANNTSTSSVTVNPAADLTIKLTATATQILVQKTVDYTVTVKNNGPSTANTVFATIAFVPHPPPMFITAPNCIYTFATGTVGCNFNTMAAGASAVRTISLKATMVGVVTTKAVVQAVSPPDPNPFNNGALWTLTVKPPSVQMLIDLLRSLAGSGGIARSTDVSLSNSLAAVDALFAKGEHVPGFALLAQMIVDLQRMETDGSVTRTAGDALIAAARAAIQ